ncbi:MAG: NAD-dependent epimerase/dehydratase family protein [Anaerolineae bacterium]
MASVYLVTGALGCIGAWTLRTLLDQNKRVVVLDLGATPTRPRLLLNEDDLARVTFIQGDVSDLAAVERVVGEHEVTHIIHLAALQVPFCKADPVLGARVNVAGTVNILEAARRSAGQVRATSYASSIAVFGPPESYPAGPLPSSAALAPTTLYGVYKAANEGTARIYWQDWQVPSIGLRPAAIYGVARDQGLTSSPTKAMLAAALGLPYHIPFGGVNCMQWAADVAGAFVQAVEAEWPGAGAFNLSGATADMAEVVRLIEAAAPDARGALTHDNTQLPFPYRYDDSALAAVIGPLHYTALSDGIAATVERFRELAGCGVVGARHVD